MSRSTDQRLEDLELLAAHQAKMLDDINDVVIEQGHVISDLRRRLEALSSRMADVEDHAGGPPGDVKPPHW